MKMPNGNCMTKQKLELTWIGKDQRPRLEPRILLEDPKRSYHAKQQVTDNDLFDNRLIRGDNLLALKALEAEFAGKVKYVCSLTRRTTRAAQQVDRRTGSKTYSGDWSKEYFHFAMGARLILEQWSWS